MAQRKFRPGTVALVAGVLLSGLTFSILGQATPVSAAESDPGSWAPGDTCTNVVVLGARGSGQTYADHGGLGAEVHGFYEGLAQALTPKSITTSYMSVPYPAVPIEGLEWLSGDRNIWDSVEYGRLFTRAFVKTIRKDCPDARIVLAGYSQGAWAIKKGANSLSDEDEESIAALVLLADPTFDPGGGGRIFGAPEADLGGIAGRLPPPGYIKSATYSVCYTSDLVCQGEDPDGSISDSIGRMWAEGGVNVHTASYKRSWVGKYLGLVVANEQFGTEGTVPGDRPDVSTALIVDSSGSMSWNDPEDRRRDAARAFLAASDPSDEVAVIDFDDSSRVASPAVQVGSNRQALFDAIATIDSDGGTDLGAGLDEGCNALQQATGTKRAALFFTDGDGSYNDEAACFASKGWSVYTFGLGTSVNSAVLEEIANTTGGSYRALDSALNLTCEFQQVRAVIGGGTAQNCTPTATIKPKQLISEAFEATAGLRQLTFTNSWIGSDIEMRLTSPSGRQILRGNEDSDVTADRGASYETVSVQWPQAGEWTVEFYGLDVPPGGEPFTFSTVELKDPNEPPVAAFEVTKGEPGSVVVDGSGSTDDSEVVGYEFFFSEDAVAEGPSATHTYPSSGSYEIVMMAVDDDLGTSLARQTVTVDVPEDQTGSTSTSSPSTTSEAPPITNGDESPATTTPPVANEPKSPSSGDDPVSPPSPADPAPGPTATSAAPAKKEVAARTPPATSTNPTATVGAKTQPNQGGGLAATGARVGSLVLLAGMALAFGATLLLTARRRRRQTPG